MQIIQYDPFEYNSVDVDDVYVYPAPYHPWPSSAGASAGTEAELPALELEREVCSNFTCCGLILSDMHALVDHFEETHVSAPKPETTRLYVLPEDRPPCPFPRLVIPFPRFLTPPPAERVPALYDSPSSPLWSDGMPSPLVPNDYLPPYLAPSPPSLPPMSFSPDAIRKKSYKSATLKDRVRVEGGRFKPSRRSDSSPAKHERGPRSRDRGRSHICPNPECVKTYLNPNGLKYHVEKGTCMATDGSAIERAEVLPPPASA